MDKYSVEHVGAESEKTVFDGHYAMIASHFFARFCFKSPQDWLCKIECRSITISLLSVNIPLFNKGLAY